MEPGLLAKAAGLWLLYLMRVFSTLNLMILFFFNKCAFCQSVIHFLKIVQWLFSSFLSKSLNSFTSHSHMIFMSNLSILILTALILDLIVFYFGDCTNSLVYVLWLLHLLLNKLGSPKSNPESSFSSPICFDTGPGFIMVTDF